MTIFTPEFMKSIVEYDPDTGVLLWKERPRDLFDSDNRHKRWNMDYAGKPAGCIDTLPTGYRRCMFETTILGEKLKTTNHRVAWAVYHGEWPDGVIDHINGDSADNCLENLRVVTPKENARNRTRAAKNKTGHTGVFYRNGRYEVSITVDYKTMYLGVYKNLEDAVAARKKAEKKYGFHENHGRDNVYAESE